MDTMETIEVASGLSMELKLAVAAIVVLATMLVLTMVSTYPYERQPATRNRGRAPRGTTVLPRRSRRTSGACWRRRRRACGGGSSTCSAPESSRRRTARRTSVNRSRWAA